MGAKKGREEEDDDDDARMLDEFHPPPPTPSPLFANSLLRRVSTTKIPETKSDQEKKKRENSRHNKIINKTRNFLTYSKKNLQKRIIPDLAKTQKLKKKKKKK